MARLVVANDSLVIALVRTYISRITTGTSVKHIDQS